MRSASPLQGLIEAHPRLRTVIDGHTAVATNSDAVLMQQLVRFVIDSIQSGDSETGEDAFDVVESLLERDHEGMHDSVRDYFVRDLYRLPHAPESYVWKMGPLTFALLKVVEAES